MLQVIKLVIGGDDECGLAYLPLEENLKKEELDSFQELKTKWESLKWGYTETAEVSLISLYTKAEIEEQNRQLELFPEYPKTELVNMGELGLTNEYDFVECEETEVICFKDLAIFGNLYTRPYEKEPQDWYYMNYWALDCRRGYIYSRDYAYFDCEECNRTICQQNPSNGWFIQYRELDADGCERICLKCYEKEILTNGMNKKILEEKSLSGLFGIQGDAQEKGFKIVEGFENFKIVGDIPQAMLDKVKELDEQGHIVIVELESMAIGGFEGYVTLHSKKPPTNQEVWDNGEDLGYTGCSRGIADYTYELNGVLYVVKTDEAAQVINPTAKAEYYEKDTE